jgi:Methane oxygenase PmoA
MTTRLPLIALALLIPCHSILAQSAFEVQQHDKGVRILLNGQLMTEYLIGDRSPILWPLIGPDGARMTRDFPMLDTTEGEKQDHPHHRSLWFGHGMVNGVDFWQKHGSVNHLSFGKITGGAVAIVEATNSWNDVDGKQLLTEKRRMTFSADDQQRWIDIDLVLIAELDEVVFGDTKEGTFAVRMAETAKVDAKLGGKIINSDGLIDAAAWGKPANWVDYTGPIRSRSNTQPTAKPSTENDEQASNTYGLAMFCHPATFNYPNRWHVRTYGLFAANPFGIKDFTGATEASAGTKLKKSEQLQFRYRVLLHSGSTDKAALDKMYQEFSKTAFPKL